MLTIKTNTYLTVSLTALLALSPLSFADNHAGEALHLLGLKLPIYVF